MLLCVVVFVVVVDGCCGCCCCGCCCVAVMVVFVFCRCCCLSLQAPTLSSSLLLLLSSSLLLFFSHWPRLSQRDIPLPPYPIYGRNRKIKFSCWGSTRYFGISFPTLNHCCRNPTYDILGQSTAVRLTEYLVLPWTGWPDARWRPVGRTRAAGSRYFEAPRLLYARRPRAPRQGPHRPRPSIQSHSGWFLLVFLF